MWVREQCMNALFTKDRSKVTATVHVPYMNSTACWGKRREKKRKRKRKRSKRNVDPNSAYDTEQTYSHKDLFSFFLFLRNLRNLNYDVNLGTFYNNSVEL